jgi:hypothetical protein
MVYLSKIAMDYRFDTHPKALGEQGETIQNWIPYFNIDLCGANANDGSYVMAQEHDARPEAVLRKQGGITWRRSLFRSSRHKMPHDYDYILIVPAMNRNEFVGGVEVGAS